MAQSPADAQSTVPGKTGDGCQIGMKTEVMIMGIQARVMIGGTSEFVCELFSYHLL